jgi:hypothetical protein
MMGSWSFFFFFFFSFFFPSNETLVVAITDWCNGEDILKLTLASAPL